MPTPKYRSFKFFPPPCTSFLNECLSAPVGREHKRVDDVSSSECVEMLGLVQVPEHSITILGENILLNKPLYHTHSVPTITHGPAIHYTCRPNVISHDTTLTISSPHVLYHNRTDLPARRTQRAIGRHSDTVEERRVAVVVGLEAAVGEVPDLNTEQRYL